LAARARRACALIAPPLLRCACALIAHAAARE
jgi:hypothetical protein